MTRVDRLTRSVGDVQNIIRELKAKKATLRATEQPIDTNTPTDEAFLDMLGVFAEFETNLRRERQMEGIARSCRQSGFTDGLRTDSRLLFGISDGPGFDVGRGMGILRAVRDHSRCEERPATDRSPPHARWGALDRPDGHAVVRSA